jgi:hypothetical protein
MKNPQEIPPDFYDAIVGDTLAFSVRMCYNKGDGGDTPC